MYIIIFRNYAKCVFNSDRYQMLINQTLKKISNDQKWNKRRSIVSLQWLKYITCLCGIKLVNVYFLNSTFSLCKYYIFFNWKYEKVRYKFVITETFSVHGLCKIYNKLEGLTIVTNHLKPHTFTQKMIQYIYRIWFIFQCILKTFSWIREFCMVYKWFCIC